MRFHPTRGSMSLSVKDGGLPPDDVVQEEDEILVESERLVATHHDPSPGAMTRVALAPCSPFSVTTELMAQTAAMAERLDVRLHTHLAEDPDEDEFCLRTFGCRPVDYLERVGWARERTWVAHCVHPNAREIRMLGAWGVGVAHCPSFQSNPGHGPCPGAGIHRRGRAGGSRLRRLCLGGQRFALARDAHGPVAGSAARRAGGLQAPGMPWSLPLLAAQPVWDATTSVRWLRARLPTWLCGPCRESRLRVRCRIPLRPGCVAGPVAARDTVVAGPGGGTRRVHHCVRCRGTPGPASPDRDRVADGGRCLSLGLRPVERRDVAIRPVDGFCPWHDRSV